MRDGLGPYLAVFLLTERHWDEASISLAMTAMGIAAVLAQIPAGALVDATRWKRHAIAAAAAAIDIALIVVLLAPVFWGVKAAM